MPQRRSVSGSIEWCYLCGLPIPHEIADPRHALFGTVDHVIALSRGGSNALHNRRAAHFMCNKVKGSKMVCEMDRDQLRNHVKGLLKSIIGPISKTLLARARSRCEQPIILQHSEEMILPCRPMLKRQKGSTAFLEP